MGLGKTLQSIAFIESVLPEVRARKLPVLIISPSSLIYNWKNELEKFTPHIEARIIDGNKVERNSLWKASSGADATHHFLFVIANGYGALPQSAFSYTVFG